MKEVMLKLCEVLDESPEQQEAIRSNYHNFIKTEGDTSRQLAKFLQFVLKEESKLARLLKGTG